MAKNSTLTSTQHRYLRALAEYPHGIAPPGTVPPVTLRSLMRRGLVVIESGYRQRLTSKGRAAMRPRKYIMLPDGSRLYYAA